MSTFTVLVSRETAGADVLDWGCVAAAGSVEVVTLVVAAGVRFEVVAGSRLVVALLGARVGPTWIVVARCSPVISMT